MRFGMRHGWAGLVLVLLVPFLTAQDVKQDVKTIHLVQHSHVDAGWNYTFLQYYLTIRLILERVTIALLRSPDRKFTFGEPVAFLAKYVKEEGNQRLRLEHFAHSWNDYDLRGGVPVSSDLVEHLHLAAQAPTLSKNWDWAALIDRDNLTRKSALDFLIKRGQLEIVGGGWVSHDELLTTSDAQRRNLRLGLRWLKENFQVRPRIAWQPDQFGHSGLTPMIYNELGYHLMVMGRIPYRQHAKMAKRGQLLFHWQGPDRKDSLLTLVLHKHYNYPSNKFDFDRPTTVCDVPTLYRELVATALESQSQYPSGNNILIPIGDDLRFMEAERWFACLARIGTYSQNQSSETGFVVQFSTLSDFAEETIDSLRPYAVYEGDFAPYADRPIENYWTGQYTTRPKLKGLIYEAERSLRSAEIIITKLIARAYTKTIADSKDIVTKVRLFRNSWISVSDRLDRARANLALLSHHDAITGTCVRSAEDDYSNLASSMIAETRQLVAESLGVPRKLPGPSAAPLGFISVQNICTKPAKECQMYLHIDEPVMQSLGGHILKIHLASSSLRWAGTRPQSLSVKSNVQDSVIQVIPIGPEENLVTLRDVFPGYEDVDERSASFLFLVQLPSSMPSEFILELHVSKVDLPQAIVYPRQDITEQIVLGLHDVAYSLSAAKSSIHIQYSQGNTLRAWTLSLAQYYPTKFEPSGAYIFRSWVVQYFPVWFLGGVGLWSSYIASLIVQLLLEIKPSPAHARWSQNRGTHASKSWIFALGGGVCTAQMLLHILLQVFNPHLLANVASSVVKTIFLIIFPSCVLGAALAWSILFSRRRPPRNPIAISVALTLGLILGSVIKLFLYPHSQARSFGFAADASSIFVPGDVCNFAIYKIGNDAAQTFRYCANEDYLSVTSRVRLAPDRELVARLATKRSLFNLPGCEYTVSDALRRTPHLYDWTSTIPTNYRPVIGTIATSDLAVAVKQPMGGTCIENGLLEMMLHRRLTGNDQKGLREMNDDDSELSVELLLFDNEDLARLQSHQRPLITDLTAMQFRPRLEFDQAEAGGYAVQAATAYYTINGLVIDSDVVALGIAAEVGRPMGLRGWQRVSPDELLVPGDKTLNVGNSLLAREHGTFRLRI